MFYLVYISSAVTPFSDEELVELLEKAVKSNTDAKITGMLLYKDGNFMQALEGDESAVRALYAKIAKDPRHRGLTTLIQGHREARQFPNWSMSFRNLASIDVRGIPGFSEFLNTQLKGDEFSHDPSRCERLLLTFKRTM